MVERLLELVARNINDPSWLLIFFSCLLGVFVGLFAVVTLATIFDDKRPPDTRLKVLRILAGFFHFRQKQHRRKE